MRLRLLTAILFGLLVTFGVFIVGLQIEREELSTQVDELFAVINEQRDMLLEQLTQIDGLYSMIDEQRDLVEKQRETIKHQEEDIELLEYLLEAEVIIEIKPIIEVR